MPDIDGFAFRHDVYDGVGVGTGLLLRHGLQDGLPIHALRERVASDALAQLTLQ